MEDWIKIFDDYIDGKFSPEEKEKFEVRFQNDSAFKAEFELHKSNRTDIESYFLKKDIDKWHDIISNSPNRKIDFSTIFKYLFIAIILLIVAAYAYHNLKSVNKESGPIMIAEYYVTDPGLPLKMNIGDEDNFKQGMVWYKAKDYEKANQYWDMVKDSDTISFFRAQIEFDEKRFTESKKLLTAINQNSSYYNKAQWYLLLICSRSKNENCDSHLEVLEANNFRSDDLDKIKLHLKVQRKN